MIRLMLGASFFPIIASQHASVFYESDRLPHNPYYCAELVARLVVTVPSCSDRFPLIPAS